MESSRWIESSTFSLVLFWDLAFLSSNKCRTWSRGGFWNDFGVVDEFFRNGWNSVIDSVEFISFDSFFFLERNKILIDKGIIG